MLLPSSCQEFAGMALAINFAQVSKKFPSEQRCRRMIDFQEPVREQKGILSKLLRLRGVWRKKYVM
jgi:hypothetical protein